jgi:tripartite-type tricarboxylate transporter receptor subunit TctC
MLLPCINKTPMISRSRRRQQSPYTVLIRAVAFLFAIAAFPAAADYPDKPIRFVITFGPGGGTDILGRILGQKLNESSGQPVVVDNRPGAGGTIGMELAARAMPDGYTLVLAYWATLTVNPALYAKLAFDPVRDFAPVTQLTAQPSILVVNPSLPVKSVGDLIALAKAKPGQLNYASAGIGTGQHLNGELLKSMAKINLVHVPYKGGIGGQILADLLTGQVQIYFVDPLPGLPHVRAGKLRPLAVTSTRRSPVLPDIPTMAQAGLPGYEVISWYGVLAPKDTPPAVVNKLYTELAKILASPDMKERFAKEGSEAVASTPEQFGAFIKAELAKWAKVIKEADIRAE